MDVQNMTALLERKQTLKILLFRLVCALLLLLIVQLFRRGINDYAIFTILIFIFLLFPSLTEFRVFSDRVEIKKYYFLATVVKTHNLNKQNDPQISTFETEFEGDSAYAPDESFWSFLPVFFSPTITVKHYTFKYIDKGVEKKLTARLTEDEYKQIDAVLIRITHAA
jgi:hypothetical protein